MLDSNKRTNCNPKKNHFNPFVYILYNMYDSTIRIYDTKLFVHNMIWIVQFVSILTTMLGINTHTHTKIEEKFLWFGFFVKITSYQRTFTNREKHSIEKRVE